MASALDSWSLSKLQVYEDCPAKFKYQYLDRVPVPEPTDPDHPFVRGRRIHKLAEDYLLGTTPEDALPDELANFSEEMRALRAHKPLVEIKWAYARDLSPTGWMTRGRNATWLRMVADAVANYGDGHVDVFDHKTGRKYPDKAKDQADLLAWGTFRRYDTVQTVSVVYWYLDQDDELALDYNRADAPALIQSFVPRVTAMETETTWPPRPSRLCGWCPFSRGEGGPCAHG